MGFTNIISDSYQFSITYSIWDDKDAKTSDSQYVTIKGTDGETDEQLCYANFNVINQDVLCVFQSPVNIGDYRCVSLRTGGSDGIDLIQVTNNRIVLFRGRIVSFGETYKTAFSVLSFPCSCYQVTFRTLQIKVQIDGTEIHTIVPQGSASFIGLDNSEMKEFCTADRHS